MPTSVHSLRPLQPTAPDEKRIALPDRSQRPVFTRQSDPIRPETAHKTDAPRGRAATTAADQGVEFQENLARRAEWNTLGTLGSLAFRAWEGHPPGNFPVEAPSITEMPGSPQNNPMMGRKLLTGSVSIQSMHMPFAPVLVISRAPELPGGLAYTLNNEVLTKKSSLQDIQLAARLSSALATA